MSELSDFSKLPDDPAYWSDLEARIVASASPSMAGEDARAWWKPLANSAWGLGGLAAAAVLAALLLAPPRAVTPLSPPLTTYFGTSIDNATVARFIAAPAPPQLTSLLADRLREGDR